MAAATVKLTIDISQELSEWLESAWRQKAASKSAYIRKLLEQERER